MLESFLLRWLVDCGPAGGLHTLISKAPFRSLLPFYHVMFFMIQRPF
jgi:hypothetical protein